MEPSTPTSATAEHRESSELAQVGDLLVAYEEFGDPAEETVLLIMGLGMQMLGWDARFCATLAERGFHVVRFDNRDVGLSSKISGRKVNIVAGALGVTGSAPYDLSDLAADTVGLLDHLGIQRAHVVGASMGGMIAQTVAASSPDRVRSLCSIISGTGKRKLTTLPRFGVILVLFNRASGSREEFIDEMVATFEKIGSPDYPSEPGELRRRAERSFDRCHYPAGTARQLMAIFATGDRSSEVARIKAPTMVIHGSKDPLVPNAAGRDTAEAIDGARFELIEGMGHDLPEPLWPRLIKLISANARTGAGA